MTSDTRAHARLAVEIALGYAIWSVGFIAIYGVNAIGCAFAWPQELQRLTLAGLALIHIALLVALLFWARARLRRSLGQAPLRAGMLTLVAGTAAAALASAALGFIPPLFLTLCQ